MTQTVAGDALLNFDHPLDSATIAEVNALLFTPDPSSEALEAADVCVVLGSRNCGYKAHRAVELFGKNPRVVFVACGGNRTEGGELEAQLIASTLRQSGVGEGRVLVDDWSTNTADNLRNAELLLRQHGLDPGAQTIAIVSSGFHFRHVMRSLPAGFGRVVYANADGPSSAKDIWHTNALGRALIAHELNRPGLLDTPVTY